MYKHYKYGYYISDKDEVKRIRNGKEEKVKVFISKSGYKYFHIFHNKENIFIHKAVANLFVPKVKTKHIIDHINRTRTDNNKDNLRCVTIQENNLNTSRNKKNKEKEN